MSTTEMCKTSQAMQISFASINLRDGTVYLPDISNVMVLDNGTSKSLRTLLGL